MMSTETAPFEWEGYCTRCEDGVSLDEGSETPTTPREAVCHACDKILIREEAIGECIEAARSTQGGADSYRDMRNRIVSRLEGLRTTHPRKDAP